MKGAFGVRRVSLEIFPMNNGEPLGATNRVSQPSTSDVVLCHLLVSCYIAMENYHYAIETVDFSNKTSDFL